MMPRLSLSSVALALWIVLASLGCRGGATQNADHLATAPQQAARLRAHLERHPEDQEAWRDLALLQWVHLAQRKEGLETLERLAEQSQDIVAATVLLIAADARLQATEVRRWGWQVLRSAATREPDPHVEALALFAARKLQAHHGSLPDDDETVFERMNQVAGKLPISARMKLLSLRASIKRRRGGDYQADFRAQGCVQSWSVGPVVGELGSLELQQAYSKSFIVDEGAPLVALSCVVRVWNPTPRAGVRRLRTRFMARTDRVRLELSGQNETRWYLDGRLIHQTDTIDRFPARDVMYEADLEPGWHEIEAITVISEENAWVLARVVEEDGRPVEVAPETGTALAALQDFRRVTAPWAEDRGPLDDHLQAPVRAYLVAEDALAEEDSDRAERAMGPLLGVPVFAEGQWLASRVALADPSRGAGASGVRERRHLARALQADPGLDAARLRSLGSEWARGQHLEVRRKLAALPRGRLRQVDGELLRWRVYAAAGHEVLAERALERAESLHSQHCDVLMARRAEARRRDDVTTERDITDRLAHCAGSLELRASYAMDQGQLQEARALWNEALERVPDDLETFEALAELSAIEGKWAEAMERHRRVLAFNPFRVDSRIAVADLLRAAGRDDEARSEVGAAMEQLPHSTPLRRVGEVIGIEDDLQAYRVDGRKAIADYRAEGAAYEGVSEVLVLDRSVSRIYDGLGARVIVHLIVHLLGKESLDRFGEIQIPEEADLLTLRSIKPDGTTIEPERVAGKDSLSLRDLEVGDMVEYEYVIDRDPTSALPGYIDVTTFRFQSPDVPYHRSELVVVHPSQLELHEERRNDPPVATVERVGGLTVRTWTALRSPRKGMEPHARSLLDEVPNVRVYTPLDVEQWLRTVTMQLQFVQRSNPQLRTLVQRLSRDATSDLERLKALRTWVTDNVEDTADLSASATRTLAARQGNRTILLLTMLREAGVRAELWLVRNRFGPEIKKGGHPLVGSYDTPMIAVWLDGAERPTMLTPSADIAPAGYVAPVFAGAGALRVALAPGQASGLAHVPPVVKSLSDRRTYDLSLELDGAGDGRASGTIELRGMEAIAWRQALREIDRDRVTEVFQEAELARFLPTASLIDFHVEHEKDLDKPLVLRFQAEVRALGVRQGGSLTIPAGLLSLNAAAVYTSLPTRVTGLLIPYASEQRARISFTFTQGALRSVPAAEQFEGVHGVYERSVEGKVGGRRLVMRLRSNLEPGVVEPSDYGELTRLTARIEAAEQAVIRVQ